MEYKFENLKEKADPGVFTQWQEVDLEIIAFTSLGINVAINLEYVGLVYKDQVYDDYEVGEKLEGYIQSVRDDGRIDVSFQANKSSHIASTADKLLKYLKAAGGKSRFNDKSSPEDIKREFQISKTVFKRTIGTLYKQGHINITDQGIELLD